MSCPRGGGRVQLAMAAGAADKVSGIACAVSPSLRFGMTARGPWLEMLAGQITLCSVGCGSNFVTSYIVILRPCKPFSIDTRCPHVNINNRIQLDSPRYPSEADPRRDAPAASSWWTTTYFCWRWRNHDRRAERRPRVHMHSLAFRGVTSSANRTDPAPAPKSTMIVKQNH